MLLSGVTKVYGAGEIAVRALRSIDFRVDRADYVAIMGSSGSGKSTLMNIIGCLDIPTEGNYLLEQLDVAQLDDQELAFIRSRRIGLVFQSYNLIPRTSVLRNVELPLVYQRVKADERRERAMRACELVGLSNRTHHIPSELSGGQQQRAAIARAIVTPSRVRTDRIRLTSTPCTAIRIASATLMPAPPAAGASGCPAAAMRRRAAHDARR